MAFCQNCGNDVGDAKFCSKCGTNINPENNVVKNTKYCSNVEIKDGIAVWDYPGTYHEHGYLISSEDDTKVLIFQSSDVAVLDSIEFK